MKGRCLAVETNNEDILLPLAAGDEDYCAYICLLQTVLGTAAVTVARPPMVPPPQKALPVRRVLGAVTLEASGIMTQS